MIFSKRSFKNFLFNLWYKFGKPPWIINQAQPDLITAVKNGDIVGPTILDVGCGNGDNAIYLASCGFNVTAVDVSNKAITMAKEKANKAGLNVTFVTLDALKIGTLNKKFDTIIDSGLFHNISRSDRESYVQAVSTVCVNNGQFLMLCFGDKAGEYEVYPNKYPKPMSQDEIRTIFAKRWKIEWFRMGVLKSNDKFQNYSSWLTAMTSVE